MNKITDVIKPIKLLHGSHADTDKTGLGCFMNVIAYLNGEAQITDHSECVCFVLRPLLIWANDWMTDKERPALIPFIERAMGSRTDDRAELQRRLQLVVKFAETQRDFAAKCAKYAKYAALSAEYAEYAEYAKCAALSAKCAATYAACAATYAEYRRENMKAILHLFDEALPKVIQTEAVHVQRAKELMAKVNA